MSDVVRIEPTKEMWRSCGTPWMNIGVVSLPWPGEVRWQNPWIFESFALNSWNTRNEPDEVPKGAQLLALSKDFTTSKKACQRLFQPPPHVQACPTPYVA